MRGGPCRAWGWGGLLVRGKAAGSFSCGIRGGREVGRVRLRKRRELLPSAREQPACAAAFTWGWGAEGGPHVLLQDKKTH